MLIGHGVTLGGEGFLAAEPSIIGEARGCRHLMKRWDINTDGLNRGRSRVSLAMNQAYIHTIRFRGGELSPIRNLNEECWSVSIGILSRRMIG